MKTQYRAIGNTEPNIIKAFSSGLRHGVGLSISQSGFEIVDQYIGSVERGYRNIEVDTMKA